MRLPRFVLAGLLLFAAVFLLAGLFSQPSFRWVGAVAAAAFVPLWYALAAVNTWIGVTSAGYPLRAEAPVFVAVFGIPAALAGLFAWGSRAYWDGGPVFETRRLVLLVAAGVALWAATLLLSNLLSQARSVAAGTGAALVVFGPLWVLVCVVNLVIGVRAVGYTVLEELPILLLNAGIPIAVAVAAARVAARRATR